MRGVAYQPDVVVVCFCINDFAWSFDGGVSKRLEQQLAQQDPGRYRRVTAVSGSFARWVLDRSRLAFAFYGLGAGLREMGTHHVRVNKSVMEGSDPVQLGIQLLREVQAKSGFKCVLFIIPGLDRPFSHYQYMRIHRRVEAIAHDTMPALEVVDLLDDLARTTDDPSGLTYDGLHLTERGHLLVARAMAVHLRALLPAPSSVRGD